MKEKPPKGRGKRKVRASLLTIARRALAIEPPTVIVAAVSGGPDSMALLSVLARLRDKHGYTLLAHGIDHGLRVEAKDELDLAADFARTLDVPFGRTRVVVASGGNVQARARTARWTALAAVGRASGGVIATAHHADDRAETFLIRLLRGAGVRGLTVLPPVARVAGAEDVGILRPLIRARRADVLAHVARHAVPCSSDPSNEDPRFLRTRIRTQVLPLLLAIDPRVIEHLNDLVDELDETTRESGVPDWARDLPRATQKALAALVRSNEEAARVWLPGGLVVAKERKKHSTSCESDPR